MVYEAHCSRLVEQLNHGIDSSCDMDPYPLLSVFFCVLVKLTASGSLTQEVDPTS